MGYLMMVKMFRRKVVIIFSVLFVLAELYWLMINDIQISESLSSQEKLLIGTTTTLSNNVGLEMPSTTHHDGPNLLEACKPVNSRLYPICKEKFEAIKYLWKSTCFREIHKLDGTDCSVLRYLQEIEPYCRKKEKRAASFDGKTEQKLEMRKDIEGLLLLLKQQEFYKMKERIIELWPEWMDARITLTLRKDFKNGKRKKILIYLGAMNYYRWLLTGTQGIMGELVQWADTITTLYVLGHEIKVVLETKDLKEELQADENGCASIKLKKSQNFDLIFTDLMGIQDMQFNAIGSSNLARLRCKFRVLDSFGTEAEFNYAGYDEPIPGGRSGWANLNLQLPQFMTYFPHSPDNTFLGFAAGGNKQKQNKTIAKKNWAVIYGKNSFYLNGNFEYLEIIKDYFELHATMRGNKKDFPHYIKNHGILNIENLKKLLSQSKLFIGLGFPFEGPGPFDAISEGAVYLNPKFSVPKNKLNDKFFEGKPILRKVTSQNSYLEDFVGEPYSYTIDIRDKEKLKNVLKRIKEQESFPPYLPREFTNLGMLEKLSVLIQNQNFCDEDSPRWPPLEKMHSFLGQQGSSCKDECHRRGMICEPSYFSDINSAENIKKYGMNCNEISLVKKTHSPSYNVTNGKCYIQDHYFYFSCVAEFQDLRRLCPCRTFMKEQTALCKDCM